jgi:hypothetical protein
MIDKLDNINKFPIIILSSPRTGSTVLAEILSNKFPELRMFLEPEFNRKGKKEIKCQLDDFTDYSKTSNQYILKFHLEYLNKYPPELIKKIINHDAFLIKIQRRSLIKQIVSDYISRVRNVYVYDIMKAYKHKDETIPIKDDLIEGCIKLIQDLNEAFNKTQINYDLEIYYEDFINSINDSYKTRFVIAPKPTNYNEIHQAIEYHLTNCKDLGLK